MWKNSLYNTIGGVLKLILGLFSVPVLTKTLGLESFGIYSSINAIVNIALFAEWSIAASITVFLSKEAAKNSTLSHSDRKFEVLSTAAIFVVFLATTTACIIWFNATWIASLFENLTDKEQLMLAKALQVSTWIVIARLTHQFFLGILQANNKYGILNILTTIYTIISFAAALILATLTGDIVLIQMFQGAIAILMIGVYYAACRRFSLLLSDYFTKPQLNHFKDFSLYGARLWILAIGSSLFSQGDRLIVLRLFGAELSGVYSAITTLCNQINVISAMPVQPLLPLMSEYYEKPTKAAKERMEPLFIKSFVVSACIIIPAGAGLIFFSTEIFQILFSRKSLDLLTIRLSIIITAFAYTVYSFNAVGYFTLLSIKKDEFTTKIVVVAGIISLYSIYILAKKFGIIGACLGNLGYSFTLILNAQAAKKLNIAKYRLVKEIFVLSAVSIVLACASFFFNNLLLSIALYIIVILLTVNHMQKVINLKDLLENSKFASVFRRL